MNLGLSRSSGSGQAGEPVPTERLSPWVASGDPLDDRAGQLSQGLPKSRQVGIAPDRKLPADLLQDLSLGAIETFFHRQCRGPRAFTDRPASNVRQRLGSRSLQVEKDRRKQPACFIDQIGIAQVM